MDWGLCYFAIANSLVLGVMCFLRASATLPQHGRHRRGLVASIFILFWVSIGAVIYFTTCVILFPWAALENALLCCVRCTRWLLCLPYRGGRSSGGSSALPEYVVQIRSHVMNEFPGEPTACAGGARVRSRSG